MEVVFPTDADGFLSQECPSCGLQFKVVFGTGSAEPISYCPYCGFRGDDCWHTTAQASYIERVVANVALAPELEKLQRQLKSMSGLVKMTMNSDLEEPGPPPLEIDDPLDILRFRCCNETIKVIPHDQLFCIICGAEIKMSESNSKKVFLSHKGLDKEIVIDFKKSLELLGYDSWLDDDAMPAGTTLERGLLKGMQDSCGVVFFITTSFKDEGFLETEINYAIQEKRSKGEKFAIITLLFVDADGKMGKIPELLKPYVWKRPTSRLDALREIVRALPVIPGMVDWREEITGVVTAPRTKSTSTELSREAKAILRAAVEANGTVMYLRHSGGEVIQAGNNSIIPDDDPRTVARWVGGLGDLQRRGFIKDRGHKGQVFEVTREGYEAADELSSE